MLAPETWWPRPPTPHPQPQKPTFSWKPGNTEFFHVLSILLHNNKYHKWACAWQKAEFWSATHLNVVSWSLNHAQPSWDILNLFRNTVSQFQSMTESQTCEKVGKPWKSGFSWIFLVFMDFHDFGKKCSTIAGKVVSTRGRDQKSTVWAHLAAKKLSVTFYFCPQT